LPFMKPHAAGISLRSTSLSFIYLHISPCLRFVNPEHSFGRLQRNIPWVELNGLKKG
jgi:hypothetical protein